MRSRFKLRFLPIFVFLNLAPGIQCRLKAGSLNLDTAAWKQKLAFTANAIAATDANDVFIAVQESGLGSLGSGYATLIKYDKSGNEEWLRTTNPGRSGSHLETVVSDHNGNAIAAGYQWGRALYHYGTLPAKAGGDRNNALIIKYDEDGGILWAHTATGTGLGESLFYAVATDAGNNIYAAGYQQGTTAYSYGGFPVSAKKPGTHALLVKFDAQGQVLWAQYSGGENDSTAFDSVVTDAAENIYVYGRQSTSTAVSYGNVTVTGSAEDAWESALVLAKYDKNGNALWALASRGGIAGYGGTIATDDAGGVFLAAHNKGKSPMALQGHRVASGEFIARIDATGKVMWIKSVGETGNARTFHAAALNSQFFLAGDGIAAKPGSHGLCPVISRFDAGGNRLARAVSADCGEISDFSRIAFSRNGNLFAIAAQRRTGSNQDGQPASMLLQYR